MSTTNLKKKRKTKLLESTCKHLQQEPCRIQKSKKSFLAFVLSQLELIELFLFFPVSVLGEETLGKSSLASEWEE